MFAVTVVLLETVTIDEADVNGEYDGIDFDYLDTDCPSAGRCIAALTRDGSLETDSRYGCTEPPAETTDDDDYTRTMCNVDYSVHDKAGLPQVISSVDIALHADSVTEFNIYVDDDDVVFGQWQATAGTTEMQEISTLRGVETSWFRIEGVMDPGEYLGILELHEDVVNVYTSMAALFTRLQKNRQFASERTVVILGTWDEEKEKTVTAPIKIITPPPVLAPPDWELISQRITSVSDS
eukprot:jgi/Undpi1/4561/HiC_scaffold_18.g07915.m1